MGCRGLRYPQGAEELRAAAARVPGCFQLMKSYGYGSIFAEYLEMSMKKPAMIDYFSTKGRYGTRLMLDHAAPLRNGQRRRHPLSTSTMTSRSLDPLFRPIIIHCVKINRLVRDLTSAGGGYALARKPEDIKLKILPRPRGRLLLIQDASRTTLLSFRSCDLRHLEDTTELLKALEQFLKDVMVQADKKDKKAEAKARWSSAARLHPPGRFERFCRPRSAAPVRPGAAGGVRGGVGRERPCARPPGCGVFIMSIVTVIGPTPPGTGVMAEAFSLTGSKSTSRQGEGKTLAAVGSATRLSASVDQAEGTRSRRHHLGLILPGARPWPRRGCRPERRVWTALADQVRHHGAAHGHPRRRPCASRSALAAQQLPDNLARQRTRTCPSISMHHKDRSSGSAVPHARQRAGLAPAALLPG